MTLDRHPDALAAGGSAVRVVLAPAAALPETVPPSTASRGTASRTATAWPDRPGTGRWVALGLAVVAATVCGWGIGTPWPWSDEGATYLALQRDWSDLAVLWSGPDAPMVPYYYLAKAWAAMLWSFWPGLSTLIAVRLLSAVAATATVVVLYALVARNAGRLAGVLSGLLLLSLAGFDRYAQEARPYALLALAATVSWLASDRRLRPGRIALGFRSQASADGEPRPAVRGLGAAAGHVVSLAAVSAVHTFGVFQWPAQLVAWLAAPGTPRTRLRRAGSIAVTLLAAALLAAGQLAITMDHGTGPPGLVAHRLVTATTITSQLLRGISMTSAPAMSALVLGLALVGSLSRAGGRREFPVSLLIWLVVPLVIELAVGAARTNLFRLRYWIAFLPPLAALAALGTVAIAGMVVRLVRGTRTSEWASWPAGARVVAGVTVLALLAVQVVTALPVQRRIRSAGGHSENLAGVFAAIADARAEHPGVRVVISNGSANGMIGAVDPAIMATNPLSRIDPTVRTVYSTAPSASSVREALAGDRYLLWIYKGEITPADAARRAPLTLAQLHPTILRATPAGTGWTALLLRLPG